MGIETPTHRPYHHHHHKVNIFVRAWNKITKTIANLWKRLTRPEVIVLLLIVGFMTWVQLRQAQQIEFMTHAMMAYGIANGKNVAKENLKKDPDLYKAVAERHYIDDAPIKTMSVHENIGKAFTHGVKLIPMWALEHIPPEQWQAEGASRIYIQELEDYVFKKRDTETDEQWLARVEGFWKYLGARYCAHDKNWGTSNFYIWCEFKGIKIIRHALEDAPGLQNGKMRGFTGGGDGKRKTTGSGK